MLGGRALRLRATASRAGSRRSPGGRRAVAAPAAAAAVFPPPRAHRRGATALRRASEKDDAEAAPEVEVLDEEEPAGDLEGEGAEEDSETPAEAAAPPAWMELLAPLREENAELAASLEAELGSLQARAAAAEALASGIEEQLTAAKDAYLRLNADFENFRKRTEKEKTELASRAKAENMEALLPTLDNFDLARQQIKAETEGEEKIVKGYQGLYTQLVQAFKTQGLETVETVGTPFDPEFHEAIMREPNDEYPDGTVIEEFRKGFRMGDRLIRPAMVKVSQGEPAPAPAAEEAAEGEAEEGKADK